MNETVLERLARELDEAQADLVDVDEHPHRPGQYVPSLPKKHREVYELLGVASGAVWEAVDRVRGRE